MKNKLLIWVVLLSCIISCKKNTGSSQSQTSRIGLSNTTSGNWTQKTSIPNPLPPDGRGLGIGFSIGDVGYMGFGTDNGTDFDDL
jgi:hypothetical protein